jgi:hypothetical protein
MEIVGLPVVDAEGRLVSDIAVRRRGAEVDPYEFALSANVHRRHLSNTQKRELVEKVLAARPNISDRRIGELAKVDHKTARSVRRNMEARGEIPTTAVLTDTKGRKQPTSKKRRDIRVGTDATADEPAQAEGAFPIHFGSCHGGRVVTERSSTKAKADRAAIKQPKPDVTAAADRAERRGDVAEPGDSDEVIRHRTFLHHASEALRHARAVASLRQEVSQQEITDDIFEAAWQAAKAWSELMEVLDPVKFAMHLTRQMDDQTRKELWAALRQKWPGEFDAARARVRSSR